MTNGEYLIYFARYIAQIIVDGSHDNLWLYKLPVSIQDSLHAVGHAFAGWLGF